MPIPLLLKWSESIVDLVLNLDVRTQYGVRYWVLSFGIRCSYPKDKWKIKIGRSAKSKLGALQEVEKEMPQLKS